MPIQLANLFRNGAVVIVPGMGGDMLGLQTEEEPVKEKERPVNREGKIVYLNPPTDRKQ